MTPDETIEQQARREAEAKYPMPVFDSHCYVYTTDTGMACASVFSRREAYAAALIAERSKPQPSVDEVMEEVILWERNDGHEYYDDPEIWHSLRDRLTKLFNK